MPMPEAAAPAVPRHRGPIPFAVRRRGRHSPGGRRPGGRWSPVRFMDPGVVDPAFTARDFVSGQQARLGNACLDGRSRKGGHGAFPPSPAAARNQRRHDRVSMHIRPSPRDVGAGTGGVELWRRSWVLGKCGPAPSAEAPGSRGRPDSSGNATDRLPDARRRRPTRRSRSGPRRTDRGVLMAGSRWSARPKFRRRRGEW